MRAESIDEDVLKTNMERFSAIDDLTVIVQGGYKYKINNEMVFQQIHHFRYWSVSRR